nr:MAG TPA: hypothetical protein [Caudoviricetes sp.]
MPVFSASSFCVRFCAILVSTMARIIFISGSSSA